MTFKFCAIVAALLLCTTSCGPDWNDCATCRPGEDSAESVDGKEQVPVVVNVTVNVDVNQNQGQTQTTPPPAVTPDAGTPPKPDAGTPPKTCRTVCTCYEERQHCDRGWHGTDHKGRCNPKPKFKKCVKEVVQCS